MPRALVVLRASRGPNRRVFRRSQILALGTAFTYSSTGWVHLCDRLAFALRNSAALTSTSSSTVALHYPCGPAWPQTRRFCASFVPAHRPTLRFSRDILVPTTGVCESCSLQGTCPPKRLMRSAPGTASSISLKQLLCKPFPVCDLEHLPTQSPRRKLRQKAFGPPPLPGRWPSDPYRPVTGLRKCPLRSCPAGCASLIEVSNHRWTFTALLRERRKARTPSIEQSSFQTSLPPNPCKSVVPPARPTQNRRNCRLPLRFSEGSEP